MLRGVLGSGTLLNKCFVMLFVMLTSRRVVAIFGNKNSAGNKYIGELELLVLGRGKIVSQRRQPLKGGLNIINWGEGMSNGGEVCKCSRVGKHKSSSPVGSYGTYNYISFLFSGPSPVF